MSEGSPFSFTAADMVERSNRGAVILAQKTAVLQQEAVVGFFTELQRVCLSASNGGRYKCELSFTTQYQEAINKELKERGFAYKWESYEGENYCIISWCPDE